MNSFSVNSIIRARWNNLNKKKGSGWLITRRSLYFIVLLLMAFSACKSTRKAIKEPIKEEGADYLFSKLKQNELKYEWFSAKFSLDIVIDKKKNSFRGQIRMRNDSAIWVSFSPALGIEMARLFITADSIKFINRLNKSFFLGDYKDVNQFLGTNVDFEVLQSILLGNDLTHYEEGKFRVSYDSREYHLVTAGRSKLKKYVSTRDDIERAYIQNIYLNPETFKITKMKIKEVNKETRKLDAFYDDFQHLGSQLFPHHLLFDITADNAITVDVVYNKIELDSEQAFPFNISPKYNRVR